PRRPARGARRRRRLCGGHPRAPGRRRRLGGAGSPMSDDTAWDADVDGEVDDDWEYPAPEGPVAVERPDEEAPEHSRTTTRESGAAEPPEARAPDEWRRAIEAVLMAATEPVEPQVLAQLIERPVAEVEGLCALLAAECTGR